jgi:type II secretory pathway pseudopilin PulG
MSRRRAFTLVEMLTVVALLIIFLGVMVSLARYVRNRSAEQLTQNLLRQLDTLMSNYVNRNAGRLPPVTPLISETESISDAHLSSAARQNNRQFIAALRRDFAQTKGIAEAPGGIFSGLPLHVYDTSTLLDAWGNPIVLMESPHPLIGMAPPRTVDGQTFFFFSAGPDGKYLTRADNLYSYEQMPTGQ